MATYQAPASFEDAFSDSHDDTRRSPFRDLEVPGVGTFQARKPMPNAVGVLGNAVNSKIGEDERNNYIGLFVQNHLSDESFDDLLEGMSRGRYGVDAVQEVCQAISTWGTSRPTRRSSTSRS